MFDRFSESARRVVFWARVEAGRLGSDAIEPEHLLLGLLIEDQRETSIEFDTVLIPQPSPPVAPFFRGETACNLRISLAKSADLGASKLSSVDMPFAERAASILSTAREHAGIATVQLLHILWALISDEQSSVCNLLIANGVTVEQVEGAIQHPH
jgi:ATP-dependent Clp protease ATP-binding subunit ClpC